MPLSKSRFPRSWIPRPYSKKRGQRKLTGDAGGVAGEVAFYMLMFLLGVFGLTLVLIHRFAPSNIADIAGDTPEALSTGLSTWVFGILSVASLLTGLTGLLLRLVKTGASSERASVLFSRTRALERGAIDMIGPASKTTADEFGDFPSVPKMRSMTDSPGERLTYRLAVANPESGIGGPLILALLWNTVWFVLLAVVVAGFWQGRPRWFVAMLLAPFALIGVWVFRYFLRQLRQQAGVGATIVEISHHPLVPGDDYQIFVSQTGRLRLKRLTVQLTCEEESFYRQGTDVRVDRHEAFTQILCKEREVHVDPMGPWEQQLTSVLPADVMHSFVGSHNAIRWKIVVTGESRPWPSFCRSFPVVVHPQGLPPKRSPR